MIQENAEDRRWHARRKFWFPSGILVDRRSGSRRQGSGSTPEDRRVSVDRRVSPRRASDRIPQA